MLVIYGLSASAYVTKPALTSEAPQVAHSPHRRAAQTSKGWALLSAEIPQPTAIGLGERGLCVCTLIVALSISDE